MKDLYLENKVTKETMRCFQICNDLSFHYVYWAGCLLA